MTTDLPFLLPVVFAGAVVQSAFGFGFSLLVAPLLLLRFEPAVGIPLLVLLNLAISVIIWWPLRGHVPVRPLLLLCGGALLGMPAGFWAFTALGDRALRILVALVVLAGVAGLARRMLTGTAGEDGEERGPGPALDLLSGAGAGVLTTSIGVPGPAVALYASWAALSRDALRALILNFYLLVFGATLVVQTVTGVVAAGTWTQGALLLPALVAGIVVGHRLAGRLSHRRFHALVLALLTVSAGSLLYTALGGGG